MPRSLAVALLAPVVLYASTAFVVPGQADGGSPVTGAAGRTAVAEFSDDLPQPVYGNDGTLRYDITDEDLRRDDRGNPVLAWATLCLTPAASGADAQAAADHYLSRYDSLAHAVVHVYQAGGRLYAFGPCGEESKLLLTVQRRNGVTTYGYNK